MKTALLLTFLLASSVVMARRHLTRYEEIGPPSGNRDAESAAYGKEHIEDNLTVIGIISQRNRLKLYKLSGKDRK